LPRRLETHYRDMQDVEFTIENGKLWMLQTRDGKRTAQAAVRIAVDMAEEGPDPGKKRCCGSRRNRSIFSCTPSLSLDAAGRRQAKAGRCWPPA
jgi:phosphoenolpyruvate synthase/pyruvate phosphate dikinase